MPSLWSLPETIASLFVESYDSGYITKVYSAVDAAEIERVLREYGVSYQTRIVRSKKQGLYYLITVLEDANATA